jgi:xanthine dehydrogenase accessory factor
MPRLVILGCGHIGQALAQMAHWVGWPLTVVDDRPDFANSGLFPAGSEVICGNFSQTIQGLQLAEIDYVVIVTRGHQYDRICLEALAGRPLAYIGMIGSRRRVQGLMEELTKDGLDEQWLRSIHSPIGLDLGAETPEEIAVSIVAEMIQVRRKGAFR